MTGYKTGTGGVRRTILYVAVLVLMFLYSSPAMAAIDRTGDGFSPGISCLGS